MLAGVRERNCPSSSISRFTAIRSARNVFVADAVSAFPLLSGPATVVAKCAVSRRGRARTIAWRSFWNRAHPLPGRAGRQFPSPTTDSQSRLPSTRRWPWSILMSNAAASRNENPPLALIKLHARNSQVGQDPVHPGIPNSCATSAILEERRVYYRHFRAKDLEPLPRQLQRLCVPVQADQPPRGQFSVIASNARPLPAWRRCTFRPALCATIRAPLQQHRRVRRKQSCKTLNSQIFNALSSSFRVRRILQVVEHAGVGS